MNPTWITTDGNEAAATVAHKLSEVIAIYPITPSTTMGELADAWSAVDRPNLWGSVPQVIEMQSEGGAAGAIHGALQAGALATTFTASQGLLLMIPNMYKIAGELTPAVFHVAARSLAAQGLSIFGDHADVMAVRATGWALLAANSVQEAQDLALIAHAATLEARLPFVHFFDGFRTSHEINKIIQLTDEQIRAMIDDDLVRAHRARGLSPDRPSIRGTAQNPDVYFQARESVNPFYLACPEIVQRTMDRFATLTGRQYRLFDYVGAPDAERVIVIMGSGAETAEQTVNYMAARGEKVGVVKVHLFRPFSVEHFINALPPTVQAIAVLDRTKEPGSAGEPMYQDVITALSEGVRSWEMGVRDQTSQPPTPSSHPLAIGGRYGLSSKEFTPAMVKAIFDELGRDTPKNHFTIGINDDVTHTSLSYDPTFSIEDDRTVRCVFWGLGADGTVGANKNSIKIIGEETDNHAQGYFVYDSKKSGSVTISHLRFGSQPIRAPYLIDQASFVACSQFAFLENFDVLKYAAPGAAFLLNSSYGPETIWDELPIEVQYAITEKHLRLFVIDANEVARATGMGGRVNTIMQTCFFAISGVLPREQAIEEIKRSIKKTYSKRGDAVVQRNNSAVDAALAHLHEVDIDARGATPTSSLARRLPVPAAAPAFVRDVLGRMIAGEGDALPVSALPCDGVYPSGTARWEKRNLALEIPVWDADLCIQCGKCAFVCPHAVIRTKIYPPAALDGSPEGFHSTEARFKEFPGMKYTLQISPEDCTGCGLCVEACPVKDKRQVGRKAINMAEQPPLRASESANWDFFLDLPEVDRSQIHLGSIKNSQLMIPLFEFSGACSGCGETPYIKLVSQLFGDHAVIANATGCSSIYGGNLPTTPWTADSNGRGPAWANSLFEDNAEFGLGMRLTLDQQADHARELLPLFADQLGQELVDALLGADQSTDAGIQAQRARVAQLRQVLSSKVKVQNNGHAAKEVQSSKVKVQNNGSAELLTLNSQLLTLLEMADALVKKDVWIIGGDGWAYDIGFGGLDHVLASGRNVNILVLDTEVYSNTGGQASKATPRGAVAKFAARGKAAAKKDLGLLAMAYGNTYVARVAMGADDQQTLKAFLEAEAYDGPSLIIAYSHCIAHGIDMRKGLDQQKLAVQAGAWLLYRYNPDLVEAGKNPLVIDSKAPSIPFEQYAYNEARYKMLAQSDEQRAEQLLALAQHDAQERWSRYQALAAPATPPANGLVSK